MNKEKNQKNEPDSPVSENAGQHATEEQKVPEQAAIMLGSEDSGKKEGSASEEEEKQASPSGETQTAGTESTTSAEAPTEPSSGAHAEHTTAPAADIAEEIQNNRPVVAFVAGLIIGALIVSLFV